MTLVIAHRGASALDVENSLAAFRRAVALGADGIELDVHGTADGRLAVFHDDRIDGSAIAELTLDQVRTHSLPNGELIPSLPETLAAIGTGTKVFVEVKGLAERHDAILLRTLDAGPAPAHYHIHSFDHRIIGRLQRKAPRRTFGILSCSYPVQPLEPLDAAAATELWQQDALIDADLVRTVHAGGCLVYAWTVDDPARMQTLRQWGVDGICTNRPDTAARALA